MCKTKKRNDFRLNLIDVNVSYLNQADFDHFLCHDELLVKVRPLAGLLRERTPDVKTGTVGKEIRKMVRSTRYNKDRAQLCGFMSKHTHLLKC